MAKIYKKRKISPLLLAVLLLLIICGIFLFYPTVNTKVERQEFTESSRELRNPKRGFYQIYRFLISDESMDYGQYIKEVYEKDVDTALSLVEINLQNYREGKITEAGLANIEELFCALSKIDKQLIVRFLYDWNGENEIYEPENIEIILAHMEQLKSVLDEFSSCIFIIQGLFIGHWGEMHGTQYSSIEDMQRLATQLNEVVDESVFLSVRTPSQWRNITGFESVAEINLKDDLLARRLSLFNDGMLGSESDCGTYAIQINEDGESIGRQEGLEFQEELCRIVPNGGEVILDNPYNDFNNAVKDLATMHVTYINNAYDKNVLEKWKRAVVTEEGCFNGMDGLSYVKCHLGYRLLITEAVFFHKLFADNISLRITMKNVGFAPIYREPQLHLCFYNRETAETQFLEIQGNLCGLAGGNESDRSMDIEADIDLSKLSEGKYEIYFLLVDPDTDSHILLANEQEEKQYGYLVGTVGVQNGLQYILDSFSDWLS